MPITGKSNKIRASQIITMQVSLNHINKMQEKGSFWKKMSMDLMFKEDKAR